MKAIKFLKTASLVLAVLLSSCTKDDAPTVDAPTVDTPAVDEPTVDNSDNSASGPFTAKVDNQSFPNIDIKFTYVQFVSSTKMLQIIGQPTDRKETIVLTLMPFGGKVTASADWKPGTYDFDPIHVTNVEYLASAEYSKWNGNGYDQWFTKWDYVKTGKIIIETNSGTHIKGTFSFDAVRKSSDGSFDNTSIRKITEGSFDLDIKTL